MKKFEYQNILLDPRDPIENKERLNYEGMKGWELVSTYPKGHGANTIFFVLKRELKDK